MKANQMEMTGGQRQGKYDVDSECKEEQLLQ